MKTLEKATNTACSLFNVLYKLVRASYEDGNWQKTHAFELKVAKEHADKVVQLLSRIKVE